MRWHFLRDGTRSDLLYAIYVSRVVRLRAQREPALLRRFTQIGGLGPAKIQRHQNKASLVVRLQIERQQALLRRVAQEHLTLNHPAMLVFDLGSGSDFSEVFRANKEATSAWLPRFGDVA